MVVAGGVGGGRGPGGGGVPGGRGAPAGQTARPTGGGGVGGILQSSEASDEPVMAIGGFNGSDPWPTLAAFQQYVASGEIHYFIAGGQGGGPGGGAGTASEITAWVEANFSATTIGETTVYDLTT